MENWRKLSFNYMYHQIPSISVLLSKKLEQQPQPCHMPIPGITARLQALERFWGYTNSPETLVFRPRNMFLFQVSWPYLGFCPNPKHFVVQYEQNLVKYGENFVKYGSKPLASFNTARLYSQWKRIMFYSATNHLIELCDANRCCFRRSSFPLSISPQLYDVILPIVHVSLTLDGVTSFYFWT